MHLSNGYLLSFVILAKQNALTIAIQKPTPGSRDQPAHTTLRGTKPSLRTHAGPNELEGAMASVSVNSFLIYQKRGRLSKMRRRETCACPFITDDIIGVVRTAIPEIPASELGAGRKQ